MSMMAQTRDLNDRKTIVDFADKVQSMERLKMLLMLTVCDIRAVGPGVWNGWKGQLLRTLYYETELLLSGGFSEVSRKERAKAARDKLYDALADWSQKDRKAYAGCTTTLSADVSRWRTRCAMRPSSARPTRRSRRSPRWCARDSFHAITEITVLSPDHPRLLTVIAGACAAAGANIVDAQIFTTPTGARSTRSSSTANSPNDADEMRRAANDRQDDRGRAVGPQAPAGGDRDPHQRPQARRRPSTVPPAVTISNTLSNKFTVIEIECLDRPGLLSEITAVLSDLSLDIASAHITTFGEKVIDTFYVTDLLGQKITNENRQAQYRRPAEGRHGGCEADEARDRMPPASSLRPAGRKPQETRA